MSLRRAVQLACGLAGGSAALLAAVAVSQSRGGGDRAGEGGGGLLPRLQAAQSWLAGPVGRGGGWDYNWDKREPHSLISPKKDKETGEEVRASQTENHKAKATRHIFLIRHSQYNLNGQNDKERTLTQLGREQAELTGKRLASLGLKYDILVYSTMTRARETAEIISKYIPGVEKVSCDLLREGAPIEPVPPLSHWKPDAAYHEDGARIEAAFRRYIHRADPKQEDDSYEIIVCHSNVIRYIVCRALQFPPEGWLRMCLNNGSITWLTIRPSGRVALRTLGDSGFMPPDKLTRS
ncbi:serine/threonine-protein phosphatase PGAM5, mitochondrial isoform X2 [Latimeria chalumnae]|uniref:Serine/threonine-protein phosphatase PGAM5, mitochondrial n=1 Tax=Latimeria chalumnae TaxID=7897 RepID=H3BE16_LATCH|nr:PREDICTED: serine/threonine-protein phosphatase PGAM5, mitochondrial isoform X2 [Latimeria chalumnae]|eukprot:XP_005990283.1 PREDICTED: serine/threonine-protein phosphatase PGAM5, mitochondrial isoform X2 [Latimeria chalumnae]